MRNNELKYNGSNYYDETAYKALTKIEREEKQMMNNNKKGEIWEIETTKGFETALVIADNDGICNVLILKDERRHENEIEIYAKIKMYTNPIMLYYKKANTFTRFVRTLPKFEFEKIMRIITEKLEICKYCNTKSNEVGEDDLTANALSQERELQEAKRQIENLKQELAKERMVKTTEPMQEYLDLKTQLAVAEAQRDVFKNQCETMFKQLMER